MGVQFFQDPDAVYDLPPDKRAKVIGMGLAMRDGDGTDIPMPVTVGTLHRWALATGHLKKRKGGK